MSPQDVVQLMLVAIAAVLAPILVATVRRFAVPSVVLELLFGILLGPQVLNLVEPTGLVSGLATLGLSMLMFLAGYELELSAIRGRPLRLGGISWGLSVALAAVVGIVAHFLSDHSGEIVIPLALTTTALGTLLPVLRDADELGTPVGRYAMALGSIGEFGPIILVALLLSGSNPVQSIAVLLAFGLLIVGAALLANRPWGEQVVTLTAKGLRASSQLPIRMTLLFMLVLAAIADRLGIDVLLGAFAAGVVVRIAASKHDDLDDDGDASSVFGYKLEGIGFGMLVPVFFVISGTRIDLKALFAQPSAFLVVPGFLLLMLVVRAIPTFLCYRNAGLERGQRRALAVMSATGLPLIVVITTIATDNGYLNTSDASAMVAAGMMSVLILPSVALALLGRERRVPVEPGAGL